MHINPNRGHIQFVPTLRPNGRLYFARVSSHQQQPQTLNVSRTSRLDSSYVVQNQQQPRLTPLGLSYTNLSHIPRQRFTQPYFPIRQTSSYVQFPHSPTKPVRYRYHSPASTYPHFAPFSTQSPEGAEAWRPTYLPQQTVRPIQGSSRFSYFHYQTPTALPMQQPIYIPPLPRPESSHMQRVVPLPEQQQAVPPQPIQAPILSQHTPLLVEIDHTNLTDVLESASVSEKSAIEQAPKKAKAKKKHSEEASPSTSHVVPSSRPIPRLRFTLPSDLLPLRHTAQELLTGKAVTTKIENKTQIKEITSSRIRLTPDLFRSLMQSSSSTINEQQEDVLPSTSTSTNQQNSLLEFDGPNWLMPLILLPEIALDRITGYLDFRPLSNFACYTLDELFAAKKKYDAVLKCFSDELANLRRLLTTPNIDQEKLELISAVTALVDCTNQTLIKYKRHIIRQIIQQNNGNSIADYKYATESIKPKANISAGLTTLKMLSDKIAKYAEILISMTQSRDAFAVLSGLENIFKNFIEPIPEVTPFADQFETLRRPRAFNLAQRLSGLLKAVQTCKKLLTEKLITQEKQELLDELARLENGELPAITYAKIPQCENVEDNNNTNEEVACAPSDIPSASSANIAQSTSSSAIDDNPINSHQSDTELSTTSSTIADNAIDTDQPDIQGASKVTIVDSTNDTVQPEAELSTTCSTIVDNAIDTDQPDTQQIPGSFTLADTENDTEQLNGEISASSNRFVSRADSSSSESDYFAFSKQAQKPSSRQRIRFSDEVTANAATSFRLPNFSGSSSSSSESDYLPLPPRRISRPPQRPSTSTDLRQEGESSSNSGSESISNSNSRYLSRTFTLYHDDGSGSDNN